jgi:hypothetical protein
MATPTTLPATFVDGNVLTAAQQNDLRGAFRVLQVVTNTTSVETSNSLTTYEDTNLTATITPSATSSKILVYVNHPGCIKTSANGLNSIKMQLHRGGSSVLQIVDSAGLTQTSLELRFGITGLYMDSPASVAALVYKTKFAQLSAGAAVTVQLNSVASQIVLMEISA